MSIEITNYLSYVWPDASDLLQYIFMDNSIYGFLFTLLMPTIIKFINCSEGEFVAISTLKAPFYSAS